MALLASCQTGEISLTPLDDVTNELTEVAVPPRQITDDVNSNEVDKILDKLFEGKQKSRAGYNISLLKDKTGKDAIICINFENNGGFALISAVKTHQPILAYAEEGNFTNTDDLKFPLNLWFEDAIEGVSTSCELPEDSLRSIRTSWRVFEDSKQKLMSRAYEPEPDKSKLNSITWEEYLELSHVILGYVNKWQADGDQVYEIDQYPRTLSIGDRFQIAGYVRGLIYPLYDEDYWAVTVIRERSMYNQNTTGAHFETKWQQYNKYNQSFDLKPNSLTDRIPVGCGPIAVGQVMYYYKYPSCFNWDGMTKVGEGNKVTSDFLLDVKGKCNATYDKDKDGTGCSTDDRIKALNTYGYSCRKLSPITIGSLYAYCPAIVSSALKFFNTTTNKEDEGGHAWIVESAINSRSYTQVEIWTFTYDKEFKCIYQEEIDNLDITKFYVNWGWADNRDGYYYFSNFTPSGYLGNTLRDAIIDIKPNK